MLKDMLLASDAAKPVAVPLPIGARAVDVYRKMIAADEEPQQDSTARGDSQTLPNESSATKPRGEKDFSVVYDYLQEQAGERAGSV